MPSSPSTIEATNTCFGYTARLTLSSERGRGDHAVPPEVDGARWLVEVTGPPTALPSWPSQDELVVSLDSFAIRGHQGVRLDLFGARSAGPGERLSYEGRVHLPEGLGGFEDGDMGRLVLWVQTPAGAFGVRGILFTVRVLSDRLEAAAPQALPSDGCPT